MHSRRMLAGALATMLAGSHTAYAAEPVLIAIGSIPGNYEDFASQTASLLRTD